MERPKLNIQEFDYSPRAIRAHKRQLQVIDALEAKNIRISLAELNSQNEKIARKEAVRMLIEVFSFSNKKERKQAFKEFKYFTNQYGLYISIKNLYKMRKIWMCSTKLNVVRN